MALEREKQEYEAERDRREQLREQREATFEPLVADAPKAFRAAQLCVLLRALVNLAPYIFSKDVAGDLPEEFKDRDAEEVLLAAHSKQQPTTSFKKLRLRLPLSVHRGIPRENEPAFLAQAVLTFMYTPKSEQRGKQPKLAKPTLVLFQVGEGSAKTAAAWTRRGWTAPLSSQCRIERR